MCGRYTLTSTEGMVEDLELAVGEPTEPSEWWRPRFNVAPTQPAPVVVGASATREGDDPRIRAPGARHLEMMRWGLVPSWADSLSVGARMINARVETFDHKPAFRDAVKSRRCLVPADGFFEWRLRGAGRSAKRFPVYLRPVPRRLVAFAGLWERWKSPDGVWIRSFTIVTGPPNALAAKFHDRMPVIVSPAHYGVWLDEDELPPALLAEILAVPEVADWQAAEVSPLANSPNNDEPACVEPVAPPEPPPETSPADGSPGSGPGAAKARRAARSTPRKAEQLDLFGLLPPRKR
jgi:putative SOS response-associated peptidase YedK